MCHESFATSDESENAAAPRRFLVPVGQQADLEAALAHILNSPQDYPIKLAILHVRTDANWLADPTQSGHAEALLAHAESRCQAAAVAHETHLFAGELVFSILDAAELLACDAILMPLCEHRPWHIFFPTKTVREMDRMRRDIPFVLIDAHGAIIRSLSHEAV